MDQVPIGTLKKKFVHSSSSKRLVPLKSNYCKQGKLISLGESFVLFVVSMLTVKVYFVKSIIYSVLYSYV